MLASTITLLYRVQPVALSRSKFKITSGSTGSFSADLWAYPKREVKWQGYGLFGQCVPALNHCHFGGIKKKSEKY